MAANPWEVVRERPLNGPVAVGPEPDRIAASRIDPARPPVVRNADPGALAPQEPQDSWTVIQERPRTWTERVVEKLNAAPALSPVESQIATAQRDADARAMTHEPHVTAPAVVAARRLPANTVKSIGALTTQMIAGLGEWGRESQAQRARQEAARARDPNGTNFATRILSKLGERTARSYDAMATRAEARQQEFAATGLEARAGAQEAVPADAGAIERGIQSGVSNAAVALPAVFVGGPVAGSVLLGAGAAGSRYSELRAAGLSPEQAASSAQKLGALETLTEFLPGRALVKNAPTFWKRVAEFLATEVPGENIASVAQLVDDYAVGVRDDVTKDDVLAAMRDTTIATLFGGGVQAGAAQVMQQIVQGANAGAGTRSRTLSAPRSDQTSPATDSAQLPSERAAEASPESQSAAPSPEWEIVAERQYVPDVSPMTQKSVASEQTETTEPETSLSAIESAAPETLSDWQVVSERPREATDTVYEAKIPPNQPHGNDGMLAAQQRKQAAIPPVVSDVAAITPETAQSAVQTEAEPVAGYTVTEEPFNEVNTQAFESARRDIRPDEDVYRTVAGSRPSQQWLEATRGTREGHEPRRFYRGSRSPLAAEKFGREQLGKATGHPTSGLGVFFSNTRDDAARYGSHVEDVHLDLRNPKIVAAEDLPPFDSLDDGYAWREQLRTQGHDGIIIDASHLGGPVWPVAFAPEQVIRAREQQVARTTTKKPAATTQPKSGIEKSTTGTLQMAGTQHVPMYQAGKAMPATGQTVTLGARAGSQRTLDVPKEPIRREHIMRNLEREFGVKVYQGKPFKARNALGFFRPSNFEVRIKNRNDLEVTAHEVFHWIDRTFPSIRKLYHQKRYDAELRSISYDASKIYEGFAEFGRLFMTQESEAVQLAPSFYDAFVKETKRLKIDEKLARIQDDMHRWYSQGAEARAESKIGAKEPPVGQRLRELTDQWGERAAASALDTLHAAKVIERELTGKIATDATLSPYKGLRLLAGARSTVNAFLNYGTLGWAADGSLSFTGKGMKQIFEPVSDVLDDTMAYFVGRRAQELAGHGKERLFTRDEIDAMLQRGRRSPKRHVIEQAFDQYQEYVKRLLNFAQQSGILSRETRQLWESLYKNYVPFYRVAEQWGGPQVSGQGTGALFKRLKGGTSNLRDTWENIAYNTALIVHASLKNVAKRQLFDTITKSPLGQRYAVRVPTDTHVVPVQMQQVEQVLRSLVGEAKTKATDHRATPAEKMHYAQVVQALDTLTGARNAQGGSSLDALQDQATFVTTGHPPSIPDRDSVLVNGERVWFQIGDRLLWDMLVELNFHKPLGLAERALGVAKRVLTRGVTMTPEFQLANIIRDTFNAYTMSRGGQLPVIDAVKAMRDIWAESDAYKLFLANGGGFGNATSDEAKAVKLRIARGNVRAILDTPAKLLDWWDKWGQSFELATRLAEFKRMRAKGASAREAAFQGREISTDFAMRGRSTLMRLAVNSLPFFGARLQGLYRLERELFERSGRQSWTGERALTYATRSLLGITLPSLLLYWANRDDEDYEALPEEIKNLYWCWKIPGTHDFALIPKPFETGAVFSTVPERLWEHVEKRNDRKLADAAKSC